MLWYTIFMISKMSNSVALTLILISHKKTDGSCKRFAVNYQCEVRFQSAAPPRKEVWKTVTKVKWNNWNSRKTLWSDKSRRKQIETVNDQMIKHGFRDRSAFVLFVRNLSRDDRPSFLSWLRLDQVGLRVNLGFWRCRFCRCVMQTLELSPFCLLLLLAKMLRTHFPLHVSKLTRSWSLWIEVW